mgnify:CR=1 FL=1
MFVAVICTGFGTSNPGELLPYTLKPVTRVVTYDALLDADMEMPSVRKGSAPAATYSALSSASPVRADGSPLATSRSTPSFEPERALTYAQYLMLLPSLARWCGLGRRVVDSLRFAIETYLRVRIPNRGGGSVLTREEAEAILSVEEREKEIEERPLSLLVHDYASVIGSSTTLDRQTVYAAILNDLLHHLEETAPGMQRRRSWTSRRRFKIATVDSLESRVQKLASCSRSVRRIVRRYFTRRLKPQSLSITVYTDGKLASRQHAVEEPGRVKEEDAEDTAESIIMGRRTKRGEENGEKTRVLRVPTSQLTEEEKMFRMAIQKGEELFVEESRHVTVPKKGDGSEAGFSDKVIRGGYAVPLGPTTASLRMTGALGEGATDPLGNEAYNINRFRTPLTMNTGLSTESGNFMGRV